jgi:hypothetical protein
MQPNNQTEGDILIGSGEPTPINN